MTPVPPRYAWLAATLGALAWVALGALFERYSPRTRYSGMGILVVLYFGVVPAAALVLALLHQLAGGRPAILGTLAVAAGAFPVLVLAYTVATNEARLAGERREAAQARLEQDRVDAELGALPLRELVTIGTADGSAELRGTTARRLAVARLRDEGRACRLSPDEATFAMTRLATNGEYTVASLDHVARTACEALRAPLHDALIDGVAARDRAASDPFLVRELADLGGDALERVNARVRFDGDAVRGAIEELLAARTPDAHRRARRILDLGLVPARGYQPLSDVLREIASERNEAWPEGAPPDERALYEALRAVETR